MDAEGVLLMTDDGDLAAALTHPSGEVPKVYRALVDRDLPADLAGLFASGTLRLAGEEKPCAPAALRGIGPREALLTLTEGRYHQVRRMFAAAGATVLALHRESFGPLDLGGLAPRAWRTLPLDTFGPQA